MNVFRYHRIQCQGDLRLDIVGRAFKVRENAETAVVTFLRSERARDHLHASLSDLKWKSELAKDSNGRPLVYPTVDGGQIEIAADRSRTAIVGEHDHYRLEAPLLWREVLKGKRVETVAVGGVEYSRVVNELVVVRDWQEAYFTPAKPVTAALVLYLDEVEIEFFDDEVAAPTEKGCGG